MKYINSIRIIAFLTIGAVFAGPVNAYERDAGVDVDAIRLIFENKVEAWNEADAVAWGADYAYDSVVVNMVGTRLEGRDQNIERHRAVFDGPLSGTSLQVEVIEISSLAPGVVLVEAAFAVLGVEEFPEGILPTEPNVLRTIMSFIMAPNEEGLWQIQFAQNTAVAPI